MTERQGSVHGPSEHELNEIRMLIEERTGICFDESRERFFSARVLCAQKEWSGARICCA